MITTSPQDHAAQMEAAQLRQARSVALAKEWFDKLGPHEMFCLKLLLMYGSSDTDILHYHIGRLDERAAHVPTHCDACGEDHFAEGLTEMASGPREERVPDPLEEELRTYNLVRNGPAFRCASCGYRYPSLEDRKVKDPGPQNCPGCVNNAKWGGPS